MNSRLRAIKEELDAMLEESQLPELDGDISHEDLAELIDQIYQEEFDRVDITEESIRVLAKNVALKVGLICLFAGEQSEADSTITITAQELTALFASLMGKGITTVKVIATE